MDYEVVKGPTPASYQGNPSFGMELGKMLGQLPDSYMQGRQAKQAIQAQDAFKDPKSWQKDDGTVDFDKIFKKGMEIGGLPFAQPLMQYMLDVKAGEQNAKLFDNPGGSGGGGSGGGQPQPQSPPNYGGQPPFARGATAPATQSPNNPPGQKIETSSAGTDNTGDQTLLGNIASQIFGDTDATPIITKIAKFMGIEPSTPLTPSQEKWAEAAMKNEKGLTTASIAPGIAPPGPGAAPGAAPPGMAPGGPGGPGAAPGGPGGPGAAPGGPGAAPGGPGAAPGGPQPQPQLAQAPLGPQGQPQPQGWRPTPEGTQEDAQRAFNRATNMRKAATAMPSTQAARSKALLEQAQAEQTRGENILKSLGEYNSPTGPQKELGNVKELADAAAAKKQAEGISEAKTKNIAARIEGIKPARDTIQVLDEMGDALSRLTTTTGAGARQVLEIKKSINNAFPGTFSNVAEAETIDKLNAQLAAAAAKSLTARPSQQEFKAFMQQNPGLNTAKETSVALVDIMRQSKILELGLGLEADKFVPGQGKSWSEVEEKYIRDHPIISPFTHKPIDARQHPVSKKWFRPNPDQPDKSKPHYWMEENSK